MFKCTLVARQAAQQECPVTAGASSYAKTAA